MSDMRRYSVPVMTPLGEYWHRIELTRWIGYHYEKSILIAIHMNNTEMRK